jgi:hypothetical protein
MLVSAGRLHELVISLLVNAKTVTTGGGYCRRIVLEFTALPDEQHRHEAIHIQPGMSRREIAAELRLAADNIEAN